MAETWRRFFSSAPDTDEIEILENAIKVAICAHPEEFKVRRSLILKRLYTCHSEDGDVHSQDDAQGEDDVEEEHINTKGGDIDVKVTESTEAAEMKHVLNDLAKIKSVIINSKGSNERDLLQIISGLGLRKLNMEVVKVAENGKSVKEIKALRSEEMSRFDEVLVDEWKKSACDSFDHTAIE